MRNKRYVLMAPLAFLVYTSFAQTQPDSVTAKVAPAYDAVGAVYRFWLGDSYRKLYNTPVKMPVLHLGEFHGGLTIEKLGGGMQTKSLHFKEANGRQWLLRSIQKYPERSLPASLRKTIAKDIVQDQISIAHPFGALTVPPFNVALDLPHAVPTLVYVKDDPNLGEYRKEFQNQAYMFEARTPFEDEKTDNTDKVIRKTLADNDTQVDQKLTLRARLLDFILGDWDRHEGNWRWDPEKEKGKKIYTPVPRDRDKVYFKTSGIFPVLLSYQWLKAHLQAYSPHIRNVAHWNFNARHFDRFFLNQLDQKDWSKEVKVIQKLITDSLIDSAMHRMPDTIYQLSAAEIEHNLKSRRDELSLSAKEYYKSLATNVDIPLSAKNEFIHLDVQPDSIVHLSVYNKKKDGTEGRKIFGRKFYPDETKELRIYGIDGQDEYYVQGNGTTPLKVRLIGGKGYDRYHFSAEFRSQRSIYVYDQKDTSQNAIPRLEKVHYRLRNDSLVNSYQYDAFVYDRKGVLFNMNYGFDRGLIVGLGYIIENQGFRKTPYAYKHEFLVSYLTHRKSFMFDYKGTLKSVWNKQDLTVHLNSMGPFNQSNFFGYGNTTIFDKSDDRDIHYYRNRYDLISGDVQLSYKKDTTLTLFYGVSGTYYHSNPENNEGHFFQDFQQQNPSEFLYGHRFFSGLHAGLKYDTRDNELFTRSGVTFQFRANAMSQINNFSRKFLSANIQWSFYKTIASDRITFANRMGGEVVRGSHYFYQSAFLGGENSLRGYNSQRFAGDLSLYNNFETRVKLASFQSYLLPGTFGITGFYDIGRVWLKGEKSTQWHQGYGGGIYFMPGDLMLIQAAVGASPEAVLPYLSVGLRF